MYIYIYTCICIYVFFAYVYINISVYTNVHDIMRYNEISSATLYMYGSNHIRVVSSIGGP